MPFTKPEEFTENQERIDGFATGNLSLTCYALNIRVLGLYCTSQWKYLVSSYIEGSEFQQRKLGYNSGSYQHISGK